MIDDKTMEHIIWATEAEMKAAIEKHGEFNSHHEAWAVLREEVQEMQECSERFSCVDVAMNGLWNRIRKNIVSDNVEQLDIDNIYDVAKGMALEAVQVMAVCKKWLKLIDEEREEDE